MKIFEDIQRALSNEMPFVVYNTPNSDFIKAFFQVDSIIYEPKDYLESGFVFAPFDNKEKAILIPTEKSQFISERISFDAKFSESIEYGPDNSQKEFHINLVKNGIKEIVNNKFQKVVLSRKEQLSLETSFDIEMVLKKLISKYRTAFVYLWYHPKVGKWMGATPETLIGVKNKEFKTMSLAGTQLYKEGEKAKWSSKEIEEQYIVTDYIKSRLETTIQDLSVDEVETIRIGNLLHLRTLISGSVEKNISSLIDILHPTPAVCGFPKEEAKEFILQNEGYNRKFYTGFLGELNIKEEESFIVSNLYVNLRCMEIVSDTLIDVYVGGGVTKESNAEKEWEETVAKSKAMKSVL
ncbi:Isochorismate synthase [Tenacibaculum sp. 190524A05c]|uniref:isochorismate synthase n=1 Tax=Tenacibaculum platacis TaxID=3137852 RepID=UPI0031FAD2F3